MHAVNRSVLNSCKCWRMSRRKENQPSADQGCKWWQSVEPHCTPLFSFLGSRSRAALSTDQRITGALRPWTLHRNVVGIFTVRTHLQLGDLEDSASECFSSFTARGVSDKNQVKEIRPCWDSVTLLCTSFHLGGGSSSSSPWRIYEKDTLLKRKSRKLIAVGVTNNRE